MTETQTRQRAPNLTGARELMLVQDLAAGERSHAELAERYGVDVQTIHNFASRHRHRIADVAKAQVADLVARGLWVADRALRLANYQLEIERSQQLIADIQAAVADISDTVGVPVSPDTDKIARLQANIFRAQAAVADELGQLPPRQEQREETKTLRHRVEGLDGWPGLDR